MSSILNSYCFYLYSLKALSLSTNEFSGTIPHSLGYCRVLSYLYLDHNNLMGTIPVDLAKLGPSVKELWVRKFSFIFL